MSCLVRSCVHALHSALVPYVSAATRACEHPAPAYRSAGGDGRTLANAASYDGLPAGGCCARTIILNNDNAGARPAMVALQRPTPCIVCAPRSTITTRRSTRHGSARARGRQQSTSTHPNSRDGDGAEHRRGEQSWWHWELAHAFYVASDVRNGTHGSTCEFLAKRSPTAGRPYHVALATHLRDPTLRCLPPMRRIALLRNDAVAALATHAFFGRGGPGWCWCVRFGLSAARVSIYVMQNDWYLIPIPKTERNPINVPRAHTSRQGSELRAPGRCLRLDR